MADLLTRKGNISQKVLELILMKRVEIQAKKETIKQLENEVKLIEIWISEIENKVIHLFKAGYKLSIGKFILSIGFKLLMPRIAWKQEFIKVTSAQRAQELMNKRIGENREFVIIERKDND